MSEEIELLKRIYDRFNARDMETVLAAMHSDVMWANGMEGGYVHGLGRRTRVLDASVDDAESARGAGRFSEGPEGDVVVEVHQVVRDLSGNVLADSE